MNAQPRQYLIALHLLLPSALSFLAMAGALNSVYIFEPNDYDYSIFSNLLWNFAHGNGWLMSLYAGSAREFFLADHLTLLVPVLAPFFYAFPSPYTLAVIHAAAFSATYFLVPFFVRAVWIQSGRQDYLAPASFLLLALFLSKAFSAAWACQSHMTTIATPFLLCALLALHSKKIWGCVLCCLILALAQERAATAVFGVGAYAFLLTGHRRLGFLLCASSFLYFLLAVKVLIPHFNAAGAYLYDDFLAPFHNLERKGLFLWQFLLMWFFLPFCGKRAFCAALCAMPIISLGLLSNRPTMSGFYHHYQDLPSIFLFAASVHGLLWLTGKRRLAGLPGAALLIAAICALCWSAEESKELLPFAALSRPAGTERLNEAIAPYAAIDPDISIYASSGIGPRLSLRERRYPISPERAARAFSSSLVVIAPTLDMYPHATADKILSALSDNTSLYLVDAAGPLVVYASNDLARSRLPGAE
ncbi:DUF2079 domain-containing protein [Desulfovibrio sp. OttesenSCG-928-G11]|nr:DUF2079 domain-containing protein [Desulfovibrio sp. OttesenSCG-928-G11]